MIDHLRTMAIFQAVAELGSFRKAAAKLNLSPSVVSHHVSKLEEELGTALLYRSTRRMSLTSEGADLLVASQCMTAAAKEGLAAIQRRAVRPTGQLRVTAATPTAHGRLAENYTRFSAAYPDVELTVHLTDSNVRLEGSEYDVAIRGWAKDLEDSSYKARKIGHLTTCFFASAAYAETRPVPRTLEDLCDWDWIRARPLPWSRLDGADPHRAPRIVLTSDNYALARRYVDDGLGFMIEAYELVADDIRDGHLVQLLPDLRTPTIDVYAVYPANSPKDSLARLFVDHMTDHRGFPR